MRYALFLLIVLMPIYVFGQSAPALNLNNLRKAKRQILDSPELPKLKLKFDDDFKYAGGHTFILYNNARAEQHFFVEADKDRNISRLYWIQFEGHLPDNTHKYDYKSPKKVNIDGLDFFADVWARKVDPKQGRPDSDGNKAQEFLRSKGFKISSDEVMMQRLVNMATPDNRSELMIIYLEVLTPTGLTAADLSPSGKGADKWPEISTQLLARAQENMRIIK